MILDSFRLDGRVSMDDLRDLFELSDDDEPDERTDRLAADARRRLGVELLDGTRQVHREAQMLAGAEHEGLGEQAGNEQGRGNGDGKTH